MSKTLKVYIAGKITDNPNYKEDFAAGAAAVLERIRFTYGRKLPVTLMLPSSEPLGLSNRHYMRISMDRIDEADIIAMLPNFEESRGAKIEELYGIYTGKQLLYITQPEFEAAGGRKETEDNEGDR